MEPQLGKICLAVLWSMKRHPVALVFRSWKAIQRWSCRSNILFAADCSTEPI